MVDNIPNFDALDPGVITEPNFGNANNALSPVERRKRAARKNQRARRWARAEAIRATWTPDQIAEEEARLQAEIEAWAEGRCDAA